MPVSGCAARFLFDPELGAEAESRDARLLCRKRYSASEFQRIDTESIAGGFRFDIKEAIGVKGSRDGAAAAVPARGS